MGNAIRDLIANIDDYSPSVLRNPIGYAQADAILAHPDIRAIIDLAAWWTDVSTRHKIDVPESEPCLPAGGYALLTNWRQDGREVIELPEFHDWDKEPW